MPNEPMWSEIEVARVKNKSRLVSLKSVQPLKMLNPGCDTAAHVVLSGYGGGMVAGDKIHLRINVQAESKLLITTQANSRVFRSEEGKVSEQLIYGNVEQEGLAVFFPDPLILHEKSRVRQVQDWKLANGAVLLTLDWLSSGRSESGEQFLFSEYFSRIQVQINDNPILIDNISFSPEGNNPRSAGVFGKYNHFINGFLAGDETTKSFQVLKNFFLSLNQAADSAQENFVKGQKTAIWVADAVKPGLLSFRAMGDRRLDLEILVRQIGKQLASPDLLGFDFLERRF